MGGKNTRDDRFCRAVKAANFITNFTSLKLETGRYYSSQVAKTTDVAKCSQNITEVNLCMDLFTIFAEGITINFTPKKAVHISWIRLEEPWKTSSQHHHQWKS